MRKQRPLTSTPLVFVCVCTFDLQDVVASAKVRDKASNARAEFQSQVESANLAQAAEGLLRLISELKTAAIVQDVTDSTQEATETRNSLEAETRSALAELGVLRDSVANTLSALEKHYYRSMPHLERTAMDS